MPDMEVRQMPRRTWSNPIDDGEGVPYFHAVQGPDRKWHWAECPMCHEIVLNSDGMGPGRHWIIARHESGRVGA